MLNYFISTFKTLGFFDISELILILISIVVLGTLFFFAIFKPHRDEPAIFNWKRIMSWVAIMATISSALMLRFVYDSQTVETATDYKVVTNLSV